MCYCSLLDAGSPPPEVLGFSDKGWCEWPSVTVCSPICSAVSLDPERCLWLEAALPLKLTELLNWVRNEDLSAHLWGALGSQSHSESELLTARSRQHTNWREITHFKFLLKHKLIYIQLFFQRCTHWQYKIVTQLIQCLFGLFYLFRLQLHTIAQTATPPSFPARPQRGLSLIWPLTQWTPWMDNSALQRGPMTIAKDCSWST